MSGRLLILMSIIRDPGAVSGGGGKCDDDLRVENVSFLRTFITFYPFLAFLKLITIFI